MKKIVNYIFLLLFSLLTLGIVLSCKEKRGELIRIWFNGSYNRDFNDLNDLHLSSAKTLGIEPVASREKAKHASRKMKEIRSNDYYDVEELTHSIPFLVPEAEKLLKDIGTNFQDTLKNHNAPLYRLLVTSITRTTEDISKLRKRNFNSSLNSAHLYGTTFDISWNRFPKVDEKDTLNIPAEDLKMALAMTLRDLQKAKRCYIKHERKQGCFHITVRKES
ncbi:DUF5715 family protein [Parabacteroides sp. Marseille-P3160]|uniref:DUF5715 family protein n=1 Tax=Parabacteroides sp. Marseille-P3160 TaxID=1917887 RepID=UPI0009BBBF93|nr:DUF5715 family protein [Parabacteroides sp. Marseille-P3160]